MSQRGADCGGRGTPESRPAAALLASLADERRAWGPGPVVLGLSGGPDSSALLLALRQIACEVRAVHVAHHLRVDAIEDEQVARSLCRLLHVPFQVVHLDGHALARDGDGWEAAARKARYAALAEAAASANLAYVLTAHTGQDRLETLWRGLATGGGVRALQGPLATRPLTPTVSVVRPLLGWFRHDVENVLGVLAPAGWRPAIDPTNRDPRRDRARVRPALQALAASESPAALARALARLQSSAALLDALLDEAWRSTVLQLAETPETRGVAGEAKASQFAPSPSITLDGRALRAHPMLVRQELVLRGCHGVGGRPTEAFVVAVAAMIDGPGNRARDGSGMYVTWREGHLTFRASAGRGSERLNPTPDPRHRYR